MFIKGNMVYADAYKYLKHKTENQIALKAIGKETDFEELSMNSPLDVKSEGNLILWNDRKFACIPQTFDKDGVKTAIVKCHYNNDDQIAIMLNKEDGEEGAMYYQKMQEWRAFASYIAKEVFKQL